MWPFAPGLFLKSQQAPSISNLHHYIITFGWIPRAWELTPLPSPDHTIPCPAHRLFTTFLQNQARTCICPVKLHDFVDLGEYWAALHVSHCRHRAGTATSFTSALIQVTPMHTPRAEGTTARASRTSLSLIFPVPVRSGERSPSSHLEGNRSKTGSTPTAPAVLLQPVIAKIRGQHVEKGAFSHD